MDLDPDRSGSRASAARAAAPLARMPAVIIDDRWYIRISEPLP
ncbi:hypothetical protein [Azospirillum endophyticum]